MQKELSELLEYWKGLRDKYEDLPDKHEAYNTGIADALTICISGLDKILTEYKQSEGRE